MKEDIFKYSNPIEVYRKAMRKYGNDVIIHLSNRKDKKYMIYDVDNNNWVHFGQMGYEDYTLHKDEFRRQRFRHRNHKWANLGKYNAGYLSYHLLW